ncbi:hypothetical protein PG988_003382 [Apiospora saccharicola]
MLFHTKSIVHTFFVPMRIGGVPEDCPEACSHTTPTSKWPLADPDSADAGTSDIIHLKYFVFLYFRRLRVVSVLLLGLLLVLLSVVADASSCRHLVFQLLVVLVVVQIVVTDRRELAMVGTAVVFPLLFEPVGQHLLGIGGSRRLINILLAIPGFGRSLLLGRAALVLCRVQLWSDFVVSQCSWLFRVGVLFPYHLRLQGMVVDAGDSARVPFGTAKQGSDLVLVQPGRLVLVFALAIRQWYRDSTERPTIHESLGRRRAQTVVALDKTAAGPGGGLVLVLAGRRELLSPVRIGGVELDPHYGWVVLLALKSGFVVVVPVDVEAEVALDNEVGVVARVRMGIEAVDREIWLELARPGGDDAVGADPFVAGFHDGDFEGVGRAALGVSVLEVHGEGVGGSC